MKKKKKKFLSVITAPNPLNPTHKWCEITKAIVKFNTSQIRNFELVKQWVVKTFYDFSPLRHPYML